MSRKQEIYADILGWALPHSRNTLSQFHKAHKWRLLSHKDLVYLRGAYEIAEFVHNLCVTILEEEFTSHDIWFLNSQARSFIESNCDEDTPHHSLMAYYIQELFKVVPEDKRQELKWPGPEGDYSWARPKRGFEIMP